MTSEFDVVVMPESAHERKTNLVLVSSVALSFISFWRAAAIVLNDMASTVYYIGGISEQAIGKAAPWFVLGVMLFAYAVRAVYVESCTMFTRGGVYRVVKQAEIALFGNRLGGVTAKLSVSALMFDYILTGPISAVSAGQYLVGMAGNLLALTPIQFQLSADAHPDLVRLLSMLIAIVSSFPNDLERPAIALAPAIGDVLAALRSLAGCRLARMSGSGATCFALVESARAAMAGARSLRVAHPTWWVRATTLGG